MPEQNKNVKYVRTNTKAHHMIELKCTKCGRTFYRKSPLNWPLRCPSCHQLLLEPEAKYDLRREKKKRHVAGPIIGGIRDESYAPSYIRTYNNEMKQHGVPFRTRLQFLSRIYGGRGGYTSEELYKIATGKVRESVFIFPFVKNAPPEVNRILESTYRRHRKSGASKQSAAIAAWTKVKQAGYVKKQKPADVWVKEHRMTKYALGPKEAAARDAAKAEVRRLRMMKKSTKEAAAVRAKDIARAARVKRQAVAEAKLAHRFRPTLEGRLASGVGRFVKRHGALIALLTAAPAIASEIQRRMQDRKSVV